MLLIIDCPFVSALSYGTVWVDEPSPFVVSGVANMNEEKTRIQDEVLEVS